MNQDLLEELITLWVLGELKEEDSEVLHNSLPEFLHKEWQDAFHGLAYDSPIVDVPDRLRANVLQKIEQEEAPFQAKRFQELAWEPHPVLAGVFFACLHTNPDRREASYLVRCEPKVRFPYHRHRGVEEILILQGEVVIGEQTYHSGDFLLSQPNSIHDPETPNGCIFYIHTSLDDEFIEWNSTMIWKLLTRPFRRKP